MAAHSGERRRGAGSHAPVLLRMLGYAWPHRLIVTTLFLASVGAGTVAAGPGLLTARLVSALAHRGHPAIVATLMWFGAVSIAAALLAFLRGVLSVTAATRISYDLRRDVVRAVRQLPEPFFEHNESYGLSGRIQDGTRQVQAFVTNTVSTVFTDVALALATLGILVGWDPFIALVALAPVPLMVLVTNRTFSRVQLAWQRQWRQGVRLRATLGEFIGLHAFFALQSGGAVSAAVDNRLAAVRDADRVAQVNDRALTAADAVLLALTLTAVWAVGSGLMERGALSLGQLVGAIVLVGRLFQSLGRLSRSIGLTARSLASARDIFSIIDRRGSQDEHHTVAMPTLPPSVGEPLHAENVSFSYGRSPVLKGISLTARAGEITAITGATGSGKTTLLKLIAGLQAPSGGAIYLGSQDLASVTPDVHAGLVTLVAQPVTLIQGTVRDNLCLGHSYPNAAIVEASQLLGAHEFIMGLPDAYDTFVAERGVTLSGGQQQRLALVRAILRSTPVLLLDEATAALDGRTEARVFEGLRQLPDTVVIVVAHRIATLRCADEVAVVSEGRIVEQGTYSTLCSANGPFSVLSQAEGALAR